MTPPHGGKMCESKRRFADQPTADNFAAAMQKRHKAKKPQRAYRCPVCRYWHLTKQSLRNRRVTT